MSDEPKVLPLTEKDLAYLRGEHQDCPSFRLCSTCCLLATVDALKAGRDKLAAENVRLRDACREAEIWFSNFGFNGYGIAVIDDYADHQEPWAAVKAALATAKDGTWRT